jgi:glutaredoxin
MRAIRWLLGKFILAWDAMFPPTAIQRDAIAQAKVDALSKQWALYQFEACPFCLKVRRAAKRMNLNLVTKDAHGDSKIRDELVREGGQYQTPCLRIENAGKARWLYESSEIIAYLERELAALGV